MPTQTTVTLYKFRELDDFAKDKVRDAVRRWYPVEGWAELILSNWREKLNATGFRDVEISYTGFWSQDDGASFTGKLDIKHYLEIANPIDLGLSTANIRRILSLVKTDALELYITVEKLPNVRYSHENSVTTSLDCDIEEGDYPRIEACVNQIHKIIASLVIRLSKNIYSDLEEEYEGLLSNESVDSFIEGNESNYLSDGTVFNLKR